MRQIWNVGTNNYVCDYIYDHNGIPMAFALSTNGGAYTYYFYDTNLQGDITAVYDSLGNLKVRFDYDAWGNFQQTGNISDALSKAILFRYRSYIYDAEIGLYYLQSRYYDPQTGRFINTDNVDVLTATLTAFTDKNLYAYCDNNPVMRVDHSGEFWHVLVAAGVGLVTQYVSDIVCNLADGKRGSDIFVPSSTVFDYIAASASGALSATGAGIGVVIAGNAAIAMVNNALNQFTHDNYKKFDFADMLIDGVVGGVVGALAGRGAGSKHLTKLGTQTIKRTVNATMHNGLKAGLKEGGKAFAYYGKNTVKYYKKFVSNAIKGILDSIAVDLIFED